MTVLTLHGSGTDNMECIRAAEKSKRGRTFLFIDRPQQARCSAGNTCVCGRAPLMDGPFQVPTGYNRAATLVSADPQLADLVQTSLARSRSLDGCVHARGMNASATRLYREPDSTPTNSRIDCACQPRMGYLSVCVGKPVRTIVWPPRVPLGLSAAPNGTLEVKSL